MFPEVIDNKLRNSDRILKIKIIDGTKPKNSTGLVDSRLFNGENNLHAIMDQATTLWFLKYDSGVVPGPLKQSFTSFKKLHEFTQNYLKNRNLEIIEVID